MHAPPQPPLVIEVRDELAARALRDLAVDHDIRIDDEALDGVVVCDDVDDVEGAARAILLVDPTPSACRRAVEAFVAGSVGAVVATDDLDQLPLVLRALEAGVASVPAPVLEQAARVPPLPARPRAVLRALLAGQTTAEVSAGLKVSDATVKRDVIDLLDLFGVLTRAQLVTTAHDLGIDPRPAGE